MSRRTVFVVVVLALALAMIAGCATPAPAQPTQAPAQPAATQAPAQPAATKAPAQPAATQPASGKKYKVALVCGLLGDRSFVDSAARGIQMAKDQLGVETKILENADVGEQQLAARAMAEQGYDLVITIGFGSADWTTEIAKAYPNTKFAIVDSTLNVPNGTGLVFKENEGSFTVGMIAGMLTKTGKVGYIGGQDVPLLRRFEAGYIQGVKYVNPNVKVTSGWVGAFNDPTKAKELAMTQYQEGADIIYAAAGKSGEGVIAAAAEKKLYAIGVDSDQCYIKPGSVITSMMKMVDVAVFQAIKSLTEGKLEAGTRVYGLKENAVGSCYLYGIDQEFVKNGPADMVQTLQTKAIPAVKAAVEKIKAGEMCVTDTMGVYPCDKPAPEGGMGK